MCALPIPETSDTYLSLVTAVSGDRLRVTSKQMNLLMYTRDFSALPEKGSPQVVVYPESVAEVCSVITYANSQRIPVVNYSAGTGLGTWMAREGGIQLDMRRMNRIVEVNDEALYAVIEPGVSYDQLSKELVPRGLVVSIPDAPPIASVLANHLGFGIGAFHQQYGVGPELILGLEVVLPSGEVIRTGGAALGDSGWFTRTAFNPVPDVTGLFTGALGTMGVVTKAAIRLFPVPAQVSYRKVGFDRMEDVVAVVQEAARRGIADRTVAFSWFFSADALKVFAPRIDGTPISATEEAQLRAQVDYPEFYLYMGVHGEADDVQSRDAKLDDLVARHSGIALEMTDANREKYENVARGIPQTVSEKEILGKKGRYEGGYDTVVAYTPLSKWGDLYREWSRLGQDHGHPFAMNAKVYGQGRFSSFRFIMTYFDPNDAADRQRMTGLKAACAEAALQLGVPVSGAGPALLPKLASFPLYKHLKQALDPNNIMHPAMTGDAITAGTAPAAPDTASGAAPPLGEAKPEKQGLRKFVPWG